MGFILSLRNFAFLAIALFSILPVSSVSARELSLSDLSLDKSRAYYGFSLGQSMLDSNDGNFTIQNQTVSAKIDDDAITGSAFYGLPLQNPWDKNLGVEASIHMLGTYDFSGTFSGNLIGTTKGEQEFLGIAGTIYYLKELEHFDFRAHAGAMYVRLTVEGQNDITSKPLQSLKYNENSGNLYFMLEARKMLEKGWYAAPSFSVIDTGDQIHTISLKISRNLNH